MTDFDYTHGTERKLVLSETVETNFYNLKNKATGPRRYGYWIRAIRFTNPDGRTAFEAELQATLDGQPYQASKQSRWYSTAEEAMFVARDMVKGSMKRYARLAADPAKNKIEHRP